MLPEPTFTFTIPSIYDDTTLDCRIYNPPHSILNPIDGEAWSPRGAIVAHPYPPFGGCYDDLIVLSTAAEIFEHGFVIGTFNFRGAGLSKGRTSWQGKPETEDYFSFVGFFVHYIEILRDCRPHTRVPKTPDTMLSSIPSACGLSSLLPQPTTSGGMKLILGGYSYGSLMTTLLPPTEDLLQRFAKVNKGTAEAEIRLRALSLAAQWNKDALLYREAQHARKTRSHENLRVSSRAMAVVVGGEESEAGCRRASHEGRRSLDTVRKSIEKSKKKLLRQHSSEVSDKELVAESLVPVEIPLPRTHYLLISLLQPPISIFATMFSHLHMAQREAKFLDHPTLVIYGDKDLFASQKRLRRWAESMKSKPKSLLQFHEVTGAGHFWREEGVETKMRGSIGEWVQDIARNE